MMARAAMIVLLLGASQALALEELEAPVQAQRQPVPPGAFAPAQQQPAPPIAIIPFKSAPPLATVLKVDLSKGTMIASETITKRIRHPHVNENGARGGRIQRVAVAFEEVTETVQKTYDLKKMKIYDAAGFQLQPNELKGRLKAGITIAWSKDAKKTSLAHSRMLERGSLILVDPNRKFPKVTRRPVHHHPVAAPAVNAPAIQRAAQPPRN